VTYSVRKKVLQFIFTLPVLCLLTGCGFLFGEDDFVDEDEEAAIRPSLQISSFFLFEGAVTRHVLRFEREGGGPLQTRINPSVADGQFFRIIQDQSLERFDGLQVAFEIIEPVDFDQPVDADGNNIFVVQFDTFFGNLETNFTVTIEVLERDSTDVGSRAIAGPFQTARLGQTVASYPDLDGDAIPEILASIRSDSGRPTAIILIRSSVFEDIDSPILNLEQLMVDPGAEVERRGQPLSPIAMDGDPFSVVSDYDQDGLPELFISGVNTRSGIANIDSVPTQAFILSGSALAVELAEIPDDGIGVALGDVGLVAGLGVPIQSSELDLGETNANVRVGSRVSGVGDLDGDGLEEIAVCLSGFGVRSRGVIILGSAIANAFSANAGIDIGTLTQTRQGLTIFEETSGNASPRGIRCREIRDAGDLDGDGFGEIAIMDPFASPSGAVHVIRGSAVNEALSDNGSFTLDLTDYPGNGLGVSLRGEPDAVVQFGSALAKIGDVDQDGIVDLAVGAPGRVILDGRYPTGSVAAEGQDHVFIVYGDNRFFRNAGADGVRTLLEVSDGQTYSVLSRADSLLRPIEGTGFGFSLAGVGDASGDGIPDLLIGSPFDGVGEVARSREESVLLVSGADIARPQDYPTSALIPGDSRLSGTRVVSWSTFPSNDHAARTDACLNDLGWSVGSAGDWDADGINDLLISAPCGDGLRLDGVTLDSDENYGEVYVLFSRSLRGSPDPTIRLGERFPILRNLPTAPASGSALKNQTRPVSAETDDQSEGF